MATRFDICGYFWNDIVPPKITVVKPKREAPDPVWLSDSYLPDYGEACSYVPDLMSDAELYAASDARQRLVWDTEFYPNYALLGFRNYDTGKILAFERYAGGELQQPDKLAWIAKNFTLVGFNDTRFDVPMLIAALAGFSTEKLMGCVNHIINGVDGRGTRPAQFYKDYGIAPFMVDNIDLIALTPLGPGLKTCAGRMHVPRMADLPFTVGKVLSPAQIVVLRWYWTNDLQNTALLYGQHKTAIELREILTQEYGVDVRSKSDPQIAEQVIRKEITRISGRKYIQRAKIDPWRSFRYVPPAYLQFRSQTMQWVLQFVCQQDFVIDADGSPVMPEKLETLVVTLGESKYKMGIGGLHSQEKHTIHVASDDVEITDSDVTSYYPALIIQQGMYPPNVGPEFKHVFKAIIDRRIAAKRAGDKATAETLKIVGNGTFGKTGEKGGYSVVYYPEMMIQVTVTGQLSLLLLIEWLELAGIPVISANTDGIVVKCPRALCATRDQIMLEWQRHTGLELEHKQYRAVYSKDVNNYVAILVDPDKKDKTPFRYAKTVGAYRKTLDVYPLKWNPTCEVCTEALLDFLATGRPIEESVRACTDVRRFIEMRYVNGGACKNGVYFGKSVRWYYSTEVDDEILNAKNGHNVPRSKGGKPCMVLPDGLPADLDYAYYVDRAVGMLADFTPKLKAGTTPPGTVLDPAPARP